MTREYFVEGVQVNETGETEYFVEGVEVNETVEAAGGAGHPTMRRWGGVPYMMPGPVLAGRSW